MTAPLTSDVSTANGRGKKSPGLIDRLRRLFYNTDGPLTQRLRLSPGGFGLGKAPAGRVPDAVTSLICGFCSTGCALDIQLRDG